MRKFIFMFLVTTMLKAADSDRIQSGKIWEESKEDLLEVMTLESTRKDLPESKWIRRDQEELDKDINELLEEILEVMRVSGLTEARESYQDLDRRIEKRIEEIRDLREASLSAPEDKSPLEFYKKTREDHLEEIDALEQDISNLEKRQDKEVREMRVAYKKMGVTLSEKDVRFYLSSVSGADMMDLSAVFDNIRKLNAQLEKLVKESPNDPEIARRYYGVHVTLIRTLLHAHKEVVGRIDDEYLVRIDELEKENDALIRETKNLIRFSEDQHQELLRSSLQTQKVTGQALDLYRKHLLAIRSRVYKGQKSLDQRFEVALNAYQTIQIAATLAEQMQSAVKDLNSLRDMHLPALVPLQSEALQQKFSEITRELEGE